MIGIYIQGDIFIIDNKEYRLRYINHSDTCWLKPVIKRNDNVCTTGGLNKILVYDELSNYEYANICL